jgi:hypothetical protein
VPTRELGHFRKVLHFCIFFDTLSAWMTEKLKPIPLVFWRSSAGREPVREWLNELPREDQRKIGHDIAKV